MAGVGQVGLRQLREQLQAGKPPQRVDRDGGQELQGPQHALWESVDGCT